MNEETKKALQEMLDAFKSGLPVGITKEDLNTQIEKLNADVAEKFALQVSKEDFDTIKASIEAQGAEIAKLAQNKGSEMKEQGITKEQLQGVAKSLETGKKADLTVKVAAAFTTANITSGTHLTSYEVVPGIQSVPREQPLVLPSLLKGVTSGRTIYWSNRINEDGGSAFIGEGVLKPLKDWDYAEENSVAKKIAVRANVSREILNDMVEFRADVDKMLRIDLLEKIDSELLDSTLSSTTVAGVTTVASGYTTTALDDQVDMPNNADAIRAAMLQMRLLNYKPNLLFINPTEAAVLDLTKST